MKVKLYKIIFLLMLLLDTVVMELELDFIRYFTKGSLMSILIILLIIQKPHNSQNQNLLHFLALIFSLCGDIVLQMKLFLPGLGSFLIAHVFYSILMITWRPRLKFKSTLLIVIVITFISFTLARWLTSDAENMQIAVTLYAITILTMGFIAYKTDDKKSLILIGAILFILSDFILALGLFKEGLPYNNIIVMWTYGIAQLLLYNGLSRKSKG